MTELACWVRAVRASASRKIEYYPFGCAGFCPDECMAISLIAASQHHRCPAMRACALALTGSSLVEPVIDAANAFADALEEADQRLSPEAVAALAASPEARGDRRRFDADRSRRPSPAARCDEERSTAAKPMAPPHLAVARERQSRLVDRGPDHLADRLGAGDRHRRVGAAVERRYLAASRRQCASRRLAPDPWPDGRRRHPDAR